MEENKKTKMEDKSAELIKELTEDIRRLKDHAQSYSRYAYLCYGIAVTASAVSTILLAAVANVPQPVLAVLAAIPGLALLYNNVFVFEAKTRWYWGKVAHYDGILKKLKYEDLSVDLASKDKREFDSHMQQQFPIFRALPSKPDK